MPSGVQKDKKQFSTAELAVVREAVVGPGGYRDIIYDNRAIAARKLGLIEKTWDLQLEVLDAPFTHRSFAVHTGHAVGKSEIISVMIVEWMMSHPDSLVVVVSGGGWPGVHQIFGILREMVERSRLKGFPKVQKASWTFSKTWFVQGFSPDVPETVQGKHSHGDSKGGTLSIVDEASKMKLVIYNALLGNTTSPGDAIGLVGNPLWPVGAFYDSCQEPNTSTHRTIHIPSTRTPNFDPNQPHFYGLATPQYAEDMRKKHGKESEEYAIRVLGEFPDQAEGILIPLSLYLACKARACIPWEEDGALTLGCDPARSEQGDRCVILVRSRTTLHHYEEHRGWTAGRIEGRIAELCRKFTVKGENLSRITAIHIDATGIGSGICDHLQAEERPFPPTRRCMAAGRAHNIASYANQKAESWFLMKEGLAGFSIPEEFIESLREVTKMMCHKNMRDQWVMQKKDEYKKEVGYSPDAGDALALTYVREVGDPAFDKVLPSVHAMTRQPTVYPLSGKWWIHLDGNSATHDQSGTIHRFLWLSRRGESGSLWLHVDEDGAWTVYDALLSSGVSVSTFWAQVSEKSRNGSVVQEYEHNVVSVQSDAKGERNLTLEIEIFKLSSDTESVRFIGQSAIGGTEGLEVLDSLIESTIIAQGDSEEAKTTLMRQLLIWPREVIDQLTNARLEEGPWKSDSALPDKEGLTGGGGSLVKCLRLAAISHPGM